MDENLKFLFDNLVQNQMYSKSYEDFQTDYSTPENQSFLWKTISDQGMYSRSLEDFQADYFQGVTPPTIVNPQYTWNDGTAEQAEIESGSYAVSGAEPDSGVLTKEQVERSKTAVKEVQEDRSLQKIRERRGGDYETPADQLARANETAYEIKQNARRTPMEKLLFKSTETETAQGSLAEYKKDMAALQTDITDLTGSIKAIDRQVKAKYGEDVYDRYHEMADAVNNQYQALIDIPEGQRTQEDIQAYNNALQELQTIAQDPLIAERDQMANLAQQSFDRAKGLLSSDDYAVVRELTDTWDSIAAYNNKQANEMSVGEKIKYFGKDILLKSVAKIPAALGALMDIGENQITGDESYTGWDRMEDWLGDLKDDVTKVAPTPSKWSRPLVTSTGIWKTDQGDRQVDFSPEGEVLAIRDMKGNKLEAFLSDEQEAEIKALDKENQWNWAGFPYQAAEVSADLLWQIAGTKGIGGGLSKVGISVANPAGAVTKATLGKGASYGAGVTLTTMGMMADPLYQEGMKIFEGDKQKAGRYALQTGLMIGLASNLFGMEARLAGGSNGLLDNVLRAQVPKGTVGASAINKTLSVLKEGLGEAIEETVIEDAIDRSVQYLMGAQPEQKDPKELMGTAVISFAVGALFGGFAPSSDSEVRDSALLAASKDPEQFEEALRAGIQAKQIDVPNIKGEEPTQEEIDEFVGNEKHKVEKIGAQIDALMDITGEESTPEVAAKLMEKNELEVKKEKAQAAGFDPLVERLSQEIEKIEEDILGTVNQMPEETDSPSTPEASGSASEASNLDPAVGSVVVTDNARGELQKDDDGYFIDFEGERVPVDTESSVEAVKEPKGKRKTKLSDRSKKITPESPQDEIAVFFAEGGRITEEDYTRYGDPNNLQDNPAVRQHYTSQTEGQNIDTVAQDIAERYGVDEQEVIQQMVDFINSDQSAGSALTEIEQRGQEEEIRADYVIKSPLKNENKPKSVIPEAVSSSRPKKVVKEAEKILSNYVGEDGNIDKEQALSDLGDKQFAVEFLQISESAYDAISETIGIPQPEPAPPVSIPDNSSSGFVSDNAIGININGKVSEVMPKLKKLFKKTFTTKGQLNTPTFRANKRRVQYIQGQMQKVKNLSRALDNVLQKEFGTQKNSLMPYIDQAMKDTDAIYDAIENQQPISTPAGDIPLEAVGVMQEMRNHVNGLSSELVAAGIVDGDLAITLLENNDAYLTRSYKVHDDPKWLNKVKGTDVWNRAKNLIRKQKENRLTFLNWQKSNYIESRKKTDSPKTKVFYQDKIKSINKDIADVKKTLANQNGELDGEVEAIIREQQDKPVSDVAQKSKLGAKDLGVLKTRKDIDPVIRELFGEYDDPMINYSRSIYKQIHLLENAKFLATVEAEGLKGGWLKTTPDEKHPAKIAGDTSNTMSPLNGYYTSPELAEAFSEFEKGLGDTLGTFMMPLIKLSSIAKYAKTILSPVTQVRNFLFNTFFMFANGLPLGTKSFTEAWKLAVTQVDAIAKSNREREEFMEYLHEIGVVGESVTYNEMKALLESADMRKPEFFEDQFSKYQKRVRKLRGAAEQFYAFGDDFWRINMFFQERNRVARLTKGKKFDELSPIEQQEVDLAASERVNAQLPTYSQIPENIKLLRAIPVAGTFVSFPYETMRVTMNSFKLMVEEANSGTTYGKVSAFKRLLGLSAISSGVLALSSLMRGMNGYDDEDEDLMRYFLPSWSENSVILPVKRDGANFTYVDLGFVIPQGFILSGINAMFDSRKNLGDRIIAAGSQYVQPFMSLDMTFQRISEALINQSNGREIASKDDPDRYSKRLGHAVSVFEPGFITTGKRIHKSFTDPELDYFGALDPTIELTTLFTGVRMSPANIEGGFKFNSQELANRKRSARGFYTKETRKQKYKDNLDSPDLVPFKEKAITAYHKVLKDAHKIYSAGVKLGGDSDVLKQHLKDAGFNSKETGWIARGLVRDPVFK